MATAAVRASRRLAPTTTACNLQGLIDVYGNREARAVTVRDLYYHGMAARKNPNEFRQKSAVWLHDELPTRLAHRVRELNELPLGLAEMPSVIEVRRMYERSLADILTCRVPDNIEDERHFTSQLDAIRTRHDKVQKLVARGVLELKETYGHCAGHDSITSFLDSFYMSRIGVRVLISHHLMLDEPYNTGDCYGIINHRCSPAELARHAIDATRTLAYAHYGEAPDVEIRGNMDLTFPYVDRHLFFSLFELLKNSLRATVETHRDAKELPPVRVIIADGEEDVAIKISDEGGGYPRSTADRMWTYMFTTAKLSAQQLLEHEENSAHINRPDPIAGFGYGLPLSRLYARYWGGELCLRSMDAYGTDAYLHLSKLGDKRECRSGLVATSCH